MKELQSTDQSSEILREVDNFFMNTSSVHLTLRNVAQRLLKQQIDYVVIGGMALALHGLVRPTQDVDLLLTASGLEDFGNKLVGLGYAPAFPGARKHFRDTETGVRIDITTTGEFPGDSIAKAVSFPTPSAVAVLIDGFKVISIEKLIELKLASALCAAHRSLRDLADVQQLVETLDLPNNFSESLHVSVQQEYQRLWQLAQLGKANENLEQ